MRAIAASGAALALAAGEQLLLLVGGGAGHSQDRAGAVDQGDAGVQHPRRSPCHGGQPGARLDRLGEGVEGRRIVGDRGHAANYPDIGRKSGLS
jgi:hypothetical protein